MVANAPIITPRKIKNWLKESWNLKSTASGAKNTYCIKKERNNFLPQSGSKRVSYNGSTKVSKTFSGGSIPSTRANVSNPAAAGRFPQPLQILTNNISYVILL